MANLFSLTTSEFDKRWPEIEEALRDWYAAETATSFDKAVEQASRRYDGDDEVQEDDEGTIWDDIPELDSKRVVEALSEIEPMLGETIPVEVIKPGGYASADEFVDDLRKKLRAKCRPDTDVVRTSPSSSPPRHAQP